MSASEPKFVREIKPTTGDETILQLSAGDGGLEELPVSQETPDLAVLSNRSIELSTKKDLLDAVNYQVLRPSKTVEDSSFAVEKVKDKELCFGTYANKVDAKGTAKLGTRMGSGIVKYNDKVVKVKMLEVNADNAEKVEIAKEEIIAAKGTGLGQMRSEVIPKETNFRINLEVSSLEISSMKGGPKVYVVRDGRPNATLNNKIYELEPNDIVISLAPALVDILTHKIGEEIISPEGRPVELPLGKVLKELIKKSTHDGEFDATDFGIRLTDMLRENKLPKESSDKMIAGAFFAYQIR